MAMYDDQQRYFDGLTGFLNEIDSGRLLWVLRACIAIPDGQLGYSSDVQY
jgi:hypothetical protein